MTDTASMARLVRARAADYRGCGAEQALVYAAEDETDRMLGARIVAAGEVDALVEAICEAEDLESPVITRGSRGRFLAAIDREAREMHLQPGDVLLSTLVHEITHLSSGADDHGPSFRDELVRLMRRHVSVEHAALLHTHLVVVGLDLAPWRA